MAYFKPGVVVEYYKGVAIMYRDRQFFYPGDIETPHGHKYIRDVYAIIDSYRPNIEEDKNKFIDFLESRYKKKL